MSVNGILRQQLVAMHNYCGVRYRNLLALLLLIVWLYASVLAHLFLQWISDLNFQHGMFVPLFALFVLWQERKKLNAIPSSPSWAGLPLVVLSMLVLVLGDRGADVFLLECRS